MIFEFGNFRLDIDVESTKAFLVNTKRPLLKIVAVLIVEIIMKQYPKFQIK